MLDKGGNAAVAVAVAVVLLLDVDSALPSLSLLLPVLLLLSDCINVRFDSAVECASDILRRTRSNTSDIVIPLTP
ncbi:hypothetical protein BDF22DRAFT_697930 [Syncephalis plumigaleata]|nr:hypothetical protein BDF22DRAFT_697930 [Syncephalis plumigaleata]